MSEAFEKIKGIEHLPVFPLPLVMLPNEFLPLHIFEDRYRRMLVDIGPEGGLFGVTRFEPADQFIEIPAAGTIGCVAEIREVQMLPDGRSNIVALGVIRYRLEEFIDSEKPYLVGDVTFFEDDDAADPEVQPLADEVFGLFERIARAAFKMSGNRGQFPEIQQTDPQSFSFLATAALNFENDLKYRLLEMTSTADRLTKLQEIMGKTVGQMEESADVYVGARSNGHSKKKLDF